MYGAKWALIIKIKFKKIFSSIGKVIYFLANE